MMLWGLVCACLVLMRSSRAASVVRSASGVEVAAKASESVGVGGPVLLEDVYLLEKMQALNRERIPERIAHARGTAAWGSFTLTNDMSNYTVAALFNRIGKVTPVVARWSSMTHSLGSPEFLRDVRGFALKFKTEEGNYDLVGINLPVFFIRDAIQYPDMLRAFKPSPVSGDQDWGRIWDYFASFPESVNAFSYLMDDVGIPKSYRHMDGWSVNTFKWINANNQTCYVRYHWESAQGTDTLTDADAVTKPFNVHTSDLYTSILAKDFPKWTLKVQMMNRTQAKELISTALNPFDATKLWPEDKFPFVEVGQLVFNQTAHQFLENEMLTFSPGRLVKGILPSTDKLLQLRTIAYADAARYRVGVNHKMLPVNRPLTPMTRAHWDGAMNFRTPFSGLDAQVNYMPSDKVVQDQTKIGATVDSEPYSGVRTRSQSKLSVAAELEQAQKRVQALTEAVKTRMGLRIATSLSTASDRVKQTWLSYWTAVDPKLAAIIVKNQGFD